MSARWPILTLGLALALALAPRPAALPAGSPGPRTGPPLQESRADTELEGWVADLDALREPRGTQALEQLSRLGAPALRRVLRDFEQVDHGARRARARLLLEGIAPEFVEPVLALLGDPDPEVRRTLTRWLGSLSLSEHAASERVAALARLAQEDPDRDVRAEALRALGESGLGPSIEVLDRLLGELPADEARQAAQALAALPAARELLLGRVEALFAGARQLPDAVLAELLHGYGRALAEVPRGGLGARERRPFLAGRVHPSPAVQAEARTALGTFVLRAAELTEPGRADEVLARLAEEGWPPEECLQRRVELAWHERGDPQAALELARALARRARELGGRDGERWERPARFYEGAALYALERLDEAGVLFDDLARELAGSLRERTDLFPSPRAREAESPELAGSAWYADRTNLLALAHVWSALVELARQGGGPAPRAVLEQLRTAHELFLRARGTVVRGGGNEASSLDALFEREFSPWSLVLFNEKLGPERRAPALDRALELAGAWASVSPSELLGFSPQLGVPAELGDPLVDPVRRAALQDRRAAEVEFLGRKLRQLARLRVEEPPARDPDALLFETRLYDQVRNQLLQDQRQEEERARAAGDPSRLSPAELRAVYERLGDDLSPSLHVLALGNELRQEGRAALTRELADRALARLRAASSGVSGVWVEWASARLELLRGSAFMDEDRPGPAEEACLEAVRRLEGVERSLAERRAGDPDEARTRDGQQRMVREMRSDALLSLAVNANVRLGDPARALEYFERAYALKQNAFMRVLLACYRARSGKAEEARAVLRSVVPTPSLYYNLACTHALLGEVPEALDLLERDLSENYPTPGSLARQREWAQKDPDLAALRAEARFQRLTGASPR